MTAIVFTVIGKASRVILEGDKYSFYTLGESFPFIRFNKVIKPNIISFHCVSVCLELTGFANGDIQLTDETFYDSVATFSCNEGYLLNGGSSRRCEAGGWSGATPSCERIGNDILLKRFTRV